MESGINFESSLGLILGLCFGTPFKFCDTVFEVADDLEDGFSSPRYFYY